MELFKPEFGLIFWMFLAFLCLYFILAKFAWPFIVKSLEQRADLIDKGVAYAQQAKANLDNAKAEADKVIAEARNQQAEIPDNRRCQSNSFGRSTESDRGRTSFY